MPDSPLIDYAVRRQVLLERLKAGQIKSFSALFLAISTIVRHEFGNLDGDISEQSKRAVALMLKSIESELRGEYAKRLKLYRLELEKTAGVFAAAEAYDLKRAVVGVGKLNVPNAKKAFSGAVNRPMSHSGETLDDFLTRFAGGETARVVDTIRKGYTNGQTSQSIIRTITGTKAAKYKDGILQTSRRATEAVVRTATQHVASSARQDLWEANRDLVVAYQWVSTLDQRTTTQCKSLDGKEFKFGEGPTPPLHIRCRSTTIAILDPEFDFLAEGRTRSAEFGPTDAKETYYDWLKRQDEGVQVEALGPQRAKLFRDGGLPPKRFAELNIGQDFEPLSLDEMKRLEPEAFKRAGLGG